MTLKIDYGMTRHSQILLLIKYNNLYWYIRWRHQNQKITNISGSRYQRLMKILKNVFYISQLHETYPKMRLAVTFIYLFFGLLWRDDKITILQNIRKSRKVTTEVLFWGPFTHREDRAQGLNRENTYALTFKVNFIIWWRSSNYKCMWK